MNISVSNLLKTIVHFFIGLVLGALSGFLSSLGAYGGDLFLRPPMLFAVSCLLVVCMHKRIGMGAVLGIVAVMFPCYWVAVATLDLHYIGLTGAVGAFLVFFALFGLLQLEWVPWFFVGGLVIFVGMLALEALASHLYQLESASGEGAGRHADGFFSGGVWIFCFWQAMMLGFLSLQLYADRLRRLAVKQA